MAKRKAAETGVLFEAEPTEKFNLSEVIREGLQSDPTASAATIKDYVLAKHPNAEINNGSFSVAFYNGRKKLGIASKRGGAVGVGSEASVVTKKKANEGGHALQPDGHGVGNGLVQIDAIKTAFELIKQAGGQASAIQLIKALGNEIGNG